MSLITSVIAAMRSFTDDEVEQFVQPFVQDIRHNYGLARPFINNQLTIVPYSAIMFDISQHPEITDTDSLVNHLRENFISRSDNNLLNAAAFNLNNIESLILGHDASVPEKTLTSKEFILSSAVTLVSFVNRQRIGLAFSIRFDNEWELLRDSLEIRHEGIFDIIVIFTPPSNGEIVGFVYALTPRISSSPPVITQYHIAHDNILTLPNTQKTRDSVLHIRGIRPDGTYTSEIRVSVSLRDISRFDPAGSAVKFEQGWLHSREYAKENYEKVQDDIYDRILDSKNSMISGYARAIGSSRYDRKVRDIDTERMVLAHSQSLDRISSIEPSKIQKVVDGIENQRRIETFKEEVYDVLFGAGTQTPQSLKGFPEYVKKMWVSQCLNHSLKINKGVASESKVISDSVNFFNSRINTQ